MHDYEVIVVGGGPAGSSAAISLAERGRRVLLLEEKRMPREKLCGEFITPECFQSLERLGVANEMLDAGAHPITRLRLVGSNGRSVETKISRMSRVGDRALGLSRARFDQILFDRARGAGAVCLEGMAVKGRLSVNGRTIGVEAVSLPEGTPVTFEAPFVIDASGRQSRLMIGKEARVGSGGARLYAMKVHLSSVAGLDDQVELCFFSGGYGGLSRVEGGRVNLCFIVGEALLRDVHGDPQKVLERSIQGNPVAGERLSTAEPVGKWLTVGPLRFCRTRLWGEGVIAVGDASGMIDPFTGTGIQMALRTGELVARCLVESQGPEDASARYAVLYRREFGSRLRVVSLLRRFALSPAAGNLAASVLAWFPSLTSRVLLATRASGSGGPT